MPAATKNPWDMTPAMRPSFESLGANSNGVFPLEDELGERAPLKDGSMLYADMVKRCLEAAATASALIPALRVTVRFTGGGAPVVDSFVAPRTTLKTADIQFQDNGDGDTTVFLDEALLPTKISDPTACANAGTDVTITATHYSDTGVRGARVKTWAGGTLTNERFTLEIW